MKKSILFTVIAALVIAVTGVAQPAQVIESADHGYLNQPREIQDYMVMREIDRIYQENPWIVDVNRLTPGQTVRVPIDQVTTWLISVDRWRAAHGTSCLWDIAKAKLDGTLRPDWDVQKAQPIEASDVPAKADTVFVERWLWAIALALALAAALLAWFLSNRRSHRLADGHPRFAYARDDQRRYPPVARWGLTGDSPQRWGHQINASHPDLNTLGQPTVVRGRLVTADGSSSGRVVVETGELNPNGTRMSREVTIRNGQEAAQATYPNGTVRYFSWGCINGLVGGNQLGLPAGWTFVPDQAQAQQAQPEAPTVTAATASAAVEPANGAQPQEALKIERRTLSGPAIRIRRERSSNGSDVQEWTIETEGDLPNPVDRVVVHDPEKGGAGDTAAVELHFLRPAPQKVGN